MSHDRLAQWLQASKGIAPSDLEPYTDLPTSPPPEEPCRGWAGHGSKANDRASQVRKHVLNEGGHAHPEPWPYLGNISADLDAYEGPPALLNGEQNFT